MTKTTYTAGEYYHIYNRGVNRRPIFFHDRNWSFFLRRLRKYFIADKADIIAYCLMPNHYHLLVRAKTDAFSHKVMQPFATSYTKAINKEQSRVGALFQGRFKGKHIERDRYLLHLSRYIHRNPVDAGLVSMPADWVFSSYREYIGLRDGTLPKPDVIISHFSSADDYAAYVEEGTCDYSIISDLMLD